MPAISAPLPIPHNVHFPPNPPIPIAAIAAGLLLVSVPDAMASRKVFTYNYAEDSNQKEEDTCSKSSSLTRVTCHALFTMADVSHAWAFSYAQARRKSYSIAANAGILITEVQYLKETVHKNFAIVDAAMNDLIRPSLYGAWQDIQPLQPRAGEGKVYDVVGPVCETGDFLGKNRNLAVEAGDLLAVRSAGAYGFTMSSNYNSRPRAAEILVDGSNSHLVRKRETIDGLFAGEDVPDL